MENNDLLDQLRVSIEADLKVSLEPLLKDLASPMGDMVTYHLGWNQAGAEGKRIRPTFTLLSCAAVKGEWRHALPAASAVEWIHNFSLIHDDIEDKSETRRGRETVWIRHGVPQAINTGDAVFALARLTTRRLLGEGVASDRIFQLQSVLDQACLELTVGQHLDLDFETRNDVSTEAYMAMIGGKTAALLEAACVVGAILGDANQAALKLYGEFGRNVGLAFQMHDDLLGIWGDVESTGKPAGDDIRSRKKTLPILYGIQHSQQARQLWEGTLTSENDVQIIIEALEAAGAKAFVSDQAEKFTETALTSLKQAQPLQPYGDILRSLALQLLQRHH